MDWMMYPIYESVMRRDGAEVGVRTVQLGRQWVCISDDSDKQFEITLSPTETGAVLVGYVDVKPEGHRASYNCIECNISDLLEISDAGIFTASASANTSSKWHSCMSLMLQLPASAVPVVRRGIEIARALAAKTIDAEAAKN